MKTELGWRVIAPERCFDLYSSHFDCRFIVFRSTKVISSVQRTLRASEEVRFPELERSCPSHSIVLRLHGTIVDLVMVQYHCFGYPGRQDLFSRFGVRRSSVLLTRG